MKTRVQNNMGNDDGPNAFSVAFFSHKREYDFNGWISGNMWTIHDCIGVSRIVHALFENSHVTIDRQA